MSTGLSRIAERAQKKERERFTALVHHLGPELLKETWQLLNRRGAPGVDGETAQAFERELDHRVEDMVARLKAGNYQAPPVRRVEIPKGDGRTRKLGVPTIEDRLLQRAVARILEAIYEAEFLEVSYGFRPGRNPHQALRALRDQIAGRKVNYVYEADIRGYFDHINHEWLRRMLEVRMGDPALLRLIGKWLRAGVMEGGVVAARDQGTPQGGPISPMLANIYLHYVLDLWFEKVFKPTCRGEAYLTRWADDFVVGFQYQGDAERFDRELRERMEKFHLQLAEEKTRLLTFGRFAEERLGRRPDTFDFLGFTHVCGRDRQGRFLLVRIPCVKSCRKFLDREWTPRVFLKAQRVQYTAIRFYNCLIRPGSIMQASARQKFGRDVISTCHELSSLFSSLTDAMLKTLLDDYLVMLYLNAVHFADLYHDPVLDSSSSFLRRKAFFRKNRLKIGLFMMNRWLYKQINSAEKRLCAFLGWRT